MKYVSIGALLLLMVTACSTNKQVDYKVYDEIIDSAEMMSYFEDLTLDTTGNSESAMILKYFDGSTDLEYEYDQGEDPSYDALYYAITVTTEKSTRSAREAFGLTKSGLVAGTKLFGGNTHEVEDIDLPGEQNYYATLHNEYGQFGFIFVTRSGKIIYSFILSGIFTEDHYTLNEVVLPNIQNLHNFTLLE